MELYTFSQWVLFFYIYCFLGWLWESAYVSIKEKHLVNRGFLKGPLLPIYGSGALCVLVVTIPFRDNVPLMCLSGMAAATVLEYVTGAVMEKIFHVRYWDYSDKFMNLNGHICLASTLCWGVMTVLVVDVLQVYAEKLVLAFDNEIITIVVFIVTPFVTADVVTSFRAAIRLRDVLVQWERVSEEMRRLAERRQELETALAERKQEFEEALDERKSELEHVVDERKSELEHAVDERKAALGELPGKLAAIRELSNRLTATQEKVAGLAAENELLRRMNEKSIRGLLKRNPRAVSFMNKEAFDEVRESVNKKADPEPDAGTDVDTEPDSVKKQGEQ